MRRATRWPRQRPQGPSLYAYNAHLDMASGRPFDQLLSLPPTGPCEPLFAPAQRQPAPRPGRPRQPRPCPRPSAARRPALMRVNHAGEIAAQALYHGQALVARSGAPGICCCRPRARRPITWPGANSGCASCVTRPACSIRSGTPARSPSARWPASSAIATASGFVAETERQVEGHWMRTGQLPAEDARSRAILEAMRADEIAHGAAAQSRRRRRACPRPLAQLMRHTARVMTRTAYWI